MVKTRFTDLVGIHWPIVQAPMIGGYSSPEMAAIVSNLGCLGTLALGNALADDIQQQCKQIEALTDNPYAVNFFARGEQAMPQLDASSASLQALRPYYQQLGIDPSVLFQSHLSALPDLNTQIEAVLSTRAQVVTFTFGIPRQDIVTTLKQHHKVVIATATTAEEAKRVQSHHFDAVILQGIGAGGHRASFLSDGNSGPDTLSLLEQSLDTISIPRIVTGGIMNGLQIAEYIEHGADACQLGTAYLFTDEAKLEDDYLKAIQAYPAITCLSKGFTGKYARVVKNTFAEEMQNQQTEQFPYQAQLTASLRQKAAQLGRHDLLPFWAGESLFLGRRQSTQSLTSTLIDELQLSLAR